MDNLHYITYFFLCITKFFFAFYYILYIPHLNLFKHIINNFYFEFDVPLSSIETIENNVKQIAPSPIITRAGIK